MNMIFWTRRRLQNFERSATAKEPRRFLGVKSLLAVICWYWLLYDIAISKEPLPLQGNRQITNKSTQETKQALDAYINSSDATILIYYQPNQQLVLTVSASPLPQF